MRSYRLLPALSIVVGELCASGAVHAGSEDPHTTTLSTVITDRDRDGLDDGIERALLARYRPFYRFSREDGAGESFRPTDVMTYLRASEVDATGAEGDRVLLSNATLRANVGRLLELTNGAAHSSLMKHPARSDFYVNPDNAARAGAWWTVVRASGKVGLYGHVVPIHLASAESYDEHHVPSGSDASLPLYYKVEYWQFFGYSSVGKPLDIGDHEGDWCTVQLLIQPARPAVGQAESIAAVLYYAHGKEMRYDVGSTRSTVPMDGEQVHELRGTAYNAPVPDMNAQGAEAAARNHVLRLYRDPASGAYTHPVVFIEHGGHEFWPSPYWSFPAVQKHTGDDDQPYLTEVPPNLGEVENPLDEDPAAPMILQFNGYWGTFSKALPGIFSNNPPPGPPLHYQWTYPVTSSIRWQLKGIDH